MDKAAVNGGIRFVIPFSLQKCTAAGFAVNRVLRIYPVYFVGFACSIAAVYIGIRVAGRPWPWPVQQFMAQIPGYHDISGLGHVDAIWTLDIEVKFYLICALFIGLFRQSSRTIFAIPIVMAAAALLIKALQPAFDAHAAWASRYISAFEFDAPLLIYMFIGTAFHYLYRRAVGLVGCIGLSAALLVVCLLLSLRGIGAVTTGPGLLAYALALVLFALCYRLRERFRPHRLTSFLADISYPLYVCHPLIGYVGLRLLVGAGMKASVSVALMTGTVVVIALLIHTLVETPSQRLYRAWRHVRLFSHSEHQAPITTQSSAEAP